MVRGGGDQLWEHPELSPPWASTLTPLTPPPRELTASQPGAASGFHPLPLPGEDGIGAPVSPSVLFRLLPNLTVTKYSSQDLSILSRAQTFSRRMRLWEGPPASWHNPSFDMSTQQIPMCYLSMSAALSSRTARETFLMGLHSLGRERCIQWNYCK